MRIDTTNLPHPMAYGLDSPYGTTLMRMAGRPEKIREILMMAKLPFGKEFDHSIAIEYLVNKEFNRMPRSRPGITWLNCEKEAAGVFSSFCEAGRMIYDVSPALSAEFAQDVPASALVQDIRLPHHAFYLRFRAADPIRLWRGRHLDGAYVYLSRDQGFIGAQFVGRRLAGWPDFHDIGIPAEIDLDPAGAVLSAALVSAINKKEIMFAALARQIMVSYGVGEGAFELPQRDFYRDSRSSVQILLNTLCNALLFLSINGASVRPGWGDQAPAWLVEQAESDQPRQRAKARDELWSLGHAKTHFLG